MLAKDESQGFRGEKTEIKESLTYFLLTFSSEGIMIMLCCAEKLNQIRPDGGNSGAIPFCTTTLSGFFIGDSQMKTIELTQGQVALVDDKDFEWLNQWRWCANWNPGMKSFYAGRYSKRKEGKQRIIYMAREVLDLRYGDKRQADHINHITLDNRRLNLRAVTNQQNHFNRKNTKGYYWNKLANKYHAQIKSNGKLIHLGFFSKAEDARNAYLQAKKQCHKIIINMVNMVN